MSDLQQKNCVSCSGHIEPLNISQAQDFIKQTPDWKIEFQGEHPALIMRDYKFKNFKLALEFVNKIGAIAEQEKHHPDIKLGWGYVNIQIQTHNINGLHENDSILASKIDKI